MIHFIHLFKECIIAVLFIWNIRWRCDVRELTEIFFFLIPIVSHSKGIVTRESINTVLGCICGVIAASGCRKLVFFKSGQALFGGWLESLEGKFEAASFRTLPSVFV